MDFKLINETTRYDVLKAASPEPWKTPMNVRIQGYTVRFVRVEMDRNKNKCVAVFSTLPPPGHTDQDVYVSLEDFWEMYDENETSSKKISLASLLNLVIMHGSIKIYCTCPSWLYGGYKYMATELDYAYGSYENRFPKIKNPKLLGTLCKHAYIIVKALPYQKFGIEAAIKRYLNSLPKVSDKTEVENKEDK